VNQFGRRQFSVMLALSIAALGGDAVAANPPGTIECTVIRASFRDAGASVDPELADLPRKEPPLSRFNDFRLVGKEATSLAPAAIAPLKLPDGRVLEVGSVKSEKDGTLHVRFQILDGKTSEPVVNLVDVTLPYGKSLYLAGLPEREGIAIYRVRVLR
jgi:hypothetical protein